MDPATGRFTQEDPIGLAGGMNLYGFTNGDPVNFSDPFGLCADSLHDKTSGKCPGGLTDAQWDRVEYAANNRMTPEARDRVLKLLHDGKIHAGSTMLQRIVAKLRGTGDPAASTSTVTGNMLIAEDVFRYPIGDFAALLAHESQHTVQPWIMGIKSSELDADAYMCANTWGRVGYLGGGYRQWGTCGAPR